MSVCIACHKSSKGLGRIAPALGQPLPILRVLQLVCMYGVGGCQRTALQQHRSTCVFSLGTHTQSQQAGGSH